MLQKPITDFEYSILFRVIHNIPGTEWIGGENWIGIRRKDPFQRKKLPVLLRFHINEQDVDTPVDSQPPVNFTGVTRGNVGDEQIMLLLASFPEEFLSFREAIRKELSLPELIPAHFAHARQKIQTFEQHETRTDAINTRIQRLPKPEYVDLPITGGNTHQVHSTEGAVITGKPPFTHLATTGVATCLGVIIKSPEAVGLAHVDTGTNIDSLRPWLDAVRSSSNIPVEVTLWGGKEDKSEMMLANLVTFLEAQPNVRITHADVLTPRQPKLGSIAVSTSGQLMIAKNEPMSERLKINPSQNKLNVIDYTGYGKNALSELRLYTEKHGIDKADYKRPPIMPRKDTGVQPTTRGI